MSAWKDMFEIRVVLDNSTKPSNPSWFGKMLFGGATATTKYGLYYRGTDTLIGSYKDMKYAIRRAKFKFKKESRKIEKILLKN